MRFLERNVVTVITGKLLLFFANYRIVFVTAPNYGAPARDCNLVIRTESHTGISETVEMTKVWKLPKILHQISNLSSGYII